MISQEQKNFGEIFLLEFTKEILRATHSYKNSLIKGEVKKIVYRPNAERGNVFSREINTPRIQNINETIRKKIGADSLRVSELRQRQKTEDIFAEFAPKSKIRHGIAPVLIIPETQLPITVRDVKPIPSYKEIDLRKINSLVRDPLVKIIECNGPDEKIVVMGQMGRKNTTIILNKEEIEDVIKKFSEATKIPISEGIYKVVIGKLILSAMVSEVIGSKFIITKM